jgi:hypothetical protein
MEGIWERKGAQGTRAVVSLLVRRPGNLQGSPPGPKGLRLGTGMNGILKCVSPAVSELPLVAERGVTPLAREPAGEGLDLQKGTLVSRSRSGSGPVGIGV